MCAVGGEAKVGRQCGAGLTHPSSSSPSSLSFPFLLHPWSQTLARALRGFQRCVCARVGGWGVCGTVGGTADERNSTNHKWQNNTGTGRPWQVVIVQQTASSTHAAPDPIGPKGRPVPPKPAASAGYDGPARTVKAAAGTSSRIK
jgi:hypothetical protein